jgi:hypothetical protein
LAKSVEQKGKFGIIFVYDFFLKIKYDFNILYVSIERSSRIENPACDYKKRFLENI